MGYDVGRFQGEVDEELIEENYDFDEKLEYLDNENDE